MQIEHTKTNAMQQKQFYGKKFIAISNYLKNKERYQMNMILHLKKLENFE